MIKKHDAQIIILDGKKLKQEKNLFKEFSRRLNFPAYFGYNWDALFDCLQNLDLKPSCKFIFINSELILSKSNNIKLFVDVIKSFEAYWVNDYEPYEEWGHKAINLSIEFYFSKPNSELENMLDL